MYGNSWSGRSSTAVLHCNSNCTCKKATMCRPAHCLVEERTTLPPIVPSLPRFCFCWAKAWWVLSDRRVAVHLRTLPCLIAAFIKPVCRTRIQCATCFYSWSFMRSSSNCSNSFKEQDEWSLMAHFPWLHPLHGNICCINRTDKSLLLTPFSKVWRHFLIPCCS